MKKILFLLIAAFALISCNKSQQTSEAADVNPKMLVLYYSQSGATATVAREIAQQAGINDLVEIKVTKPYDGDFQQTIARCQQEMADGILPQLDSLPVNIDDYDVIFLGYPVWFGTYASPVASLLKNYNFAGKRIFPFMTFGSGGRLKSTLDLVDAQPQADILGSFAIRTARLAHVSAEVEQYLISWGFIEGEARRTVPFGSQRPVNDKEIAIFQQACGSYQFPLGTPISVAVRDAGYATEYMFYAVNNNDTLTIPVVLGKDEGAVAEFLEVLR